MPEPPPFRPFRPFSPVVTLLAASRAWEVAYARALEPVGLTVRKHGLLGHMANNAGVSFSELARRAGITVQSAHGVARTLVEAGYVGSPARLRSRAKPPPHRTTRCARALAWTPICHRTRWTTRSERPAIQQHTQELMSVAVLLGNLATVHDAVLARVLGPVHGGLYLVVAATALLAPGLARPTRVVAVLPRSPDAGRPPTRARSSVERGEGGMEVRHFARRALSVDVSEAMRLVDEGAVIVDVRRRWEWDRTHAPGAIHVPLEALDKRCVELTEDSVLIASAPRASGPRARRTCCARTASTRST